MSNLPQETIDKIKADAKAYMHAEIKSMVGDEELQPSHLQYAHQAGATEWAGKAQEFASFIQRSLDQHEADKESLLKEWPQLKNKIDDSMLPWINEAKQLLAKYKEVTK